MDLNPGQRFALQEMGIPVWELRAQAAAEPVTEKTVTAEATSQIDSEAIKRANCLIVINQQHELEANGQRLLGFMLQVAEIPQNRTAIITLEQLPSVKQQLSTDNKERALFVFGESVAEQCIANYDGFESHLGKPCQTSEAMMTAFVCDSLSNLLTNPSNKYQSWLSLLAAKDFYQHLS